VLGTARYRHLVKWTQTLAFATAALAIATFLVALFSWSGSVDTANLAKAAQEARDIAKDTEIRQLRAYVGVSDHTIDNVVVGRESTISLKFKNSGQTPASDVHYTIWRQFGSGPSEENYHGNFVLFHDDVYTMLWNVPILTAFDLNALRDGSKMLKINGLIKYKDAFGGERTTKFGLIYGGELMMRVGRLGWAEDGNGAE
jgi:hypothetical protein